MKKKVIVRCPALSLSGYGHHARVVLRSLRKYEDFFDIYLNNINWGKTGWIYEDNEERRWLDSLLIKTLEYQKNNGKYDISVQCTIPNEFENLAITNIGVTAGIETTKVSPIWLDKCNQMDRIIVVSNHAKHGFITANYQRQNRQTGEVVGNLSCNVPIEVIHYPTEKIKPINIDLSLKCDFNFLIVAQWGPRKNIDNSVKWFIEEFHEEEVGLVLKVSTKNNSTMDKEFTKKRLEALLSNFPNRKCSIGLIHGHMSDEEMRGLYTHSNIKALICISHGECYGLPMFDSAQEELPIITCLWAGQCDYLFAPVIDKKTGKEKNKGLVAKVDYDLGPIQKECVWPGVLEENTQWCYPKKGSYKSSLREVYKNYGRFKSQAKKIKEYICENFSEEKIYKQYAEVILGESVQEVKIVDLPKVSTITSVFNAGEYLPGLLQDLEKQTLFRADKVETVFIHPKNSKDFALEEKLISDFKEKHGDKVIYKQLEKDLGVYDCWNVGIKTSTGDYITNANCDDRKHEQSLEKHARELYLNSDIDLVYSDSFITHKSNEIFEKNTSDGKRYNFEQPSVESMLRGNQPHNNPMWKRSLHEKNGYFDTQYFSCSDWDYWLKCIFSGAKFKKIDGVWGLYLFNEKGLSTNKETEKEKRKQELSVFKKWQKIYMESMKK